MPLGTRDRVRDVLLKREVEGSMSPVLLFRNDIISHLGMKSQDCLNNIH